MLKETQLKLAEKEINSSTLMSAGCGAIPVSYIDIGATMAVQVRMMKNLCDIYEVKWDEMFIKSLIGSAIGNIGKRMGVSMLKSIPFIGTIIGAPINAILSGVSTYAMGHAFLKYMAINSTVKSVKDIDVKAFTTLYNGFSKQADAVTKMVKDRMRGLSKEDSVQSNETVFAYGERMFGSKDQFHAWLGAVDPMLGKKPIDLLLSKDEADHETVRKVIGWKFAQA